jgi:hypothetical protein
VNEEDYRASLDRERKLFAWCFVNYGDLSAEEAQKRAEAFYEYEPPDDPYRWLVFHENAWYWVMQHIVGNCYWTLRPDLAEPSEAYLRYEDSLASRPEQ